MMLRLPLIIVLVIYSNIMKKNNKGFTLIELLVTITIIGILASIGLVSYRSVSERSRNARREADLSQIRSALELYRSDTNNYPSSTGDLVSDYMQSLPKDPSNDTDYTYDMPFPSTPVTKTYRICAPEYEDETLPAEGYCLYNP